MEYANGGSLADFLFAPREMESTTFSAADGATASAEGEEVRRLVAPQRMVEGMAPSGEGERSSAGARPARTLLVAGAVGAS